jgi:hypothetical protein
VVCGPLVNVDGTPNVQRRFRRIRQALWRLRFFAQ